MNEIFEVYKAEKRRNKQINGVIQFFRLIVIIAILLLGVYLS